MFTGLIEAVGTIRKLDRRNNYRVMTVDFATAADDLRIGESIACDGACLTVVSFDKRSFVVEVSQETIAGTILPGYTIGSQINLERAMKLGDRLGGHLVSGHIDDIAQVDTVKRIGESWELAVKHDSRHDSLVVTKGSIAVNGVSLTVNNTGPGWFTVNIIPHTYKETNLGLLKTGDKVNLEFDLLGKYILKIMEGNVTTGLTIDKLRQSGW